MLRLMRFLLKMISNVRSPFFKAASIALLLVMSSGGEVSSRYLIAGQKNEALTPMQREIERQRQRLKSEDIEDRRDALMRLGNLKRPDASRVAAAGLTDVEPKVRVAAIHAILSLPQTDAATLLIPLLQDKMEFVRREGAYALGETRSRSAVTALASLLLSDKDAGVRSAAAVALGQIGDESAVEPLAAVLAGQPPRTKKPKVGENDSVKRAAARSLGQIKSRAGVSVLIATLTNDANENDVRREAATALGLIGDASAGPALQAAFGSSDPYLAEAARTARRRLKSVKN
ncbi:MAG: hypothetical protein QOH41_1028 [Blastocatellia bacterium]|nr:hypothetical protein [Blastocatellia bacterium]